MPQKRSVVSGTAWFIESTLADVVPTQLGMHDKVLVINVNPFRVGGGPVEPPLVDPSRGPRSPARRSDDHPALTGPCPAIIESNAGCRAR